MSGNSLAINNKVLQILLGLTLALTGVIQVFSLPPAYPATEMISLAGDTTQANHASQRTKISSDGKYVVYYSLASNLVAGDINGRQDVFLRDLVNNTTELVSVSTEGDQGDQHSTLPAVNGDGRYVVFVSASSTLGSSPGFAQIFLRDRLLGTTEIVSRNTSGVAANLHSSNPTVSSDGRYVAFVSSATNLVSGDTNNREDVFLRDLQTGVTEIVSLADDESLGNLNVDTNVSPDVSSDGRFVAFGSDASNLVASDTNGFRDIFVRDRQLGTTDLVSLTSNEIQCPAVSQWPSITDDGNQITFHSTLPIDTDCSTGGGGAFMHDRGDQTTIRVGSGGGSHADITPSGSHIVYSDFSSIKLRTMSDFSLTTLISGNNEFSNPSISSSANTIAFGSAATNIGFTDTNGFPDAFVHYRAPEETPLLCNSIEPTIVGTEGDDVINGTDGPDVIMGLGGDDELNGKQGDDVICGGEGEDEIYGRYGNDILFGDAGEDFIDGNQNDDVIDGGSEDDVLEGGYGQDVIAGGGGDDTITANQDADQINGGEDSDSIEGGYGDDTIYGGNGDDNLVGNQGADYLDGEAGTNNIDGSSGIDTCLNGVFTDCEL